MSEGKGMFNVKTESYVQSQDELGMRQATVCTRSETIFYMLLGLSNLDC